MSKTSPNSDRGAQKQSGRSSISRRGVLKATGAGLAGAGLSGVTGTASAAGLTIAPLTRDGNQIVDPQGEEVTLHGVSIADPGEASRTWRGMDSSEVFDMATSHPDWSNTLVRVPMQAEFIATGEAAASGPGADALPHGDDWGPAMPGTYDASTLEGYLSGLIDPLVEQAEENGAYIMLDYHRHFPVFHHTEQEEYVNAEGGSPLEDPCYDDIQDVWLCNSANEVDHTVVPDGPSSNYPVRPNEGRAENVCGERGILWHGEDQVEDIMDLVEEQNVVENYKGVESMEDIHTEPAELSVAMDAELKQFWEVVADRYADSDAVVFDIYNEPTGPYAGDWGGPERVAGALSDAPAAQKNAEHYEVWGAYAKPFHDLWVERSQPWVDMAEDNGQGQLMTIGNPRWSQYVHWAPYNEYDNENMCYTSHVYLQENCRPLQKMVGWPAENVPIFFSEFGWMNFDLTVPTPWMDGGIEWGTGDTDPADVGERGESWSFERFIDNSPVHPVCWAFDHTWEPNFFEHGAPGGGECRGTTGATGEDHWYDDGDWLIEEDTPGAFWQEYVNAQDESISSGDDYYADADTGPNELDQGEGLPDQGYYPADFYTPPNGGGDCEGAEASETLEDGSTVCDVDGDGQYRDVSGDGSVTNSDVTEFFGNQHVDPWDSRPDLFDFNGDDEVSQADVIELFSSVN